MENKDNFWINEYGVDTRIQKIALNLLLQFDYFCKKNNLKYYLHSGTLLGAIRDGGIIPWDDDIDVSMPREDYEKLLEIGGSFSSPYYLASYKSISDSSYPYQWAKLEDKRTHIKEKLFPNGRKDAGIFIDIFPLDVVPDSLKKQKKVVKKAIKWKIFLLSYYDYYDPRAGLRWFWKTIKFFLKLRYKDGNSLHRAVDKAFINRYSGGYLADLFGWDMQGVAKKEDYGNNKTIDFQGYNLQGPENPIALLEHGYGDWQTPPKMENRKAAHGFDYKIDDGIYLEHLKITL